MENAVSMVHAMGELRQDRVNPFSVSKFGMRTVALTLGVMFAIVAGNEKSNPQTPETGSTLGCSHSAGSVDSHRKKREERK
jgi:hypothetical protein